jgi:hypothetical protein
MSVGIKETKEVVAAGLAIIAGLRSALADGDVDIWDLKEVPKLIGPLKVAVADVGQLPKELGDLDSDELGELYAMVKDVVLDATPDEYEFFVVLALDIVKGLLKKS